MGGKWGWVGGGRVHCGDGERPLRRGWWVEAVPDWRYVLAARKTGMAVPGGHPVTWVRLASADAEPVAVAWPERAGIAAGYLSQVGRAALARGNGDGTK